MFIEKAALLFSPYYVAAGESINNNKSFAAVVGMDSSLFQNTISTVSSCGY